MRFALILVLGLVFAGGLGFAAHLIARDTVALPVTGIEAGDGLAPVAEQRRTTTSKRTASSTTTAATTTTTTATETGDDGGGHRGRGRNRGHGGDDD
jgi:hypothetical protein